MHFSALSALALALCVTVIAVGATAPTQGATESATAQEKQATKKNRYIGAQKCQSCHDKVETGNQQAHWLASKHAQAFTNLGTDHAKEVAKAKGLGDPQKEAACVKCHVTAHGVDAAELQKGFDTTLGVQCETCHGPGEQHMFARMKAARTKTEGYPDIPADEIVSMPTADSCRTCHNAESPTFKPFCPHERMEQIKHWNPLKPRSDELKQKGYPCTCDETCVCRQEGTDGKCRSAKDPAK